MKPSRLAILAIIVLGLAAPARADLVDGARAYRDGDHAAALAEFRSLAAEGNAYAQYAIGLMYAEGAGMAQDHGMAAEWFHKAAEAGVAQAQYNLAVAYHQGLGVERDLTAAVYWYRQAAEQGDPRAQNNLGYLYENGTGVPTDYVEAAKWYERSAERGNVNAQINLANMYRSGRGVVANRELAMAWLRKAVGDWDTSDPLKLWIVDRTGMVQPYNSAIEAGLAAQTGAVESGVLVEPGRAEPAPGADAGEAESSGELPMGMLVAPAKPDEAAEPYHVQLGAYSTAARAERGWAVLREAHPDLLGGDAVGHAVDKVDVAGRDDPIHLVLAGPFADEAPAKALCNALRDRDVDCFLIQR